MTQTVPSHRDPVSRPGHSMWDFWWTKWHWNWSFLRLIRFPCQYHSTVAVSTYTLSGRRTIGPLVAAAQRHNVSPPT
jgi:hypothetical protein